MSNQDVYDKEDVAENTGQHDDLGVHPERREAEVDSLNKQFDNSDLNSAEEAGAGGSTPSKGDKKELDQIGSGFRNEERANKMANRAKSLMSGRRGKLIMGGGLGGGIAGLIIAGMLLLPLKVMHIVNNVQDHFFASSEKAAEDMTDRLLRAYIVSKVMPGMIEGKCTSTKSTRSCVKVTPGDGPVAILYNAWRDARFEEKLATKHGIEIERYGKNKFRLITPSIKEGIDLGTYDSSKVDEMDGRMFAAMNRSQVRREIRGAFQDETFAKRIMYRYKLGRLAERKHGVKRCLIGCDTRDRFNEKSTARKNAWKGYFIDRVILPRNEMMGVAMRCAIGGFRCTDTPSEADANGERPSEFEEETRAIMARNRAEGKNLDDLERQTEDLNNKGFSTVLLEKMIGETSTQILKKGIPVVGWLDLGANLFSGAQKAGPAAQKINYVMNSQAMITTYMLYRTHADEIKAGAVNADVVGSITSSLGPAEGADQNGVGAEASPLYQNLMGSSPAPKTASIVDMFLPKASAASKGYVCEDDKPVDTASGELVCPEEKLSSVRGAAKVAGGISLVANSGPLAPLAFAADFWNSTAGKVLDKLGDGLGGILGFLLKPLMDLPGVDTIINQSSKLIQALAEWFIGWFINNPIGENPSGARNVNLAAGGADVLGNDLAHYNLGAKEVDQATANSIRAQIKQEERDEFMQQSFFARAFDTSSEHSLVSKAALAMPSTTLGGVSQAITAKLTNPLTYISAAFGSTPTTSAAQSDKDPFGVTQYAYDPNDEVFKADPEVYWEKHDCDNPDQVKKWGEKSKDNADTGMPEHNETNGCMLLRSAIGMGGAVYTDAVLTAEDLGQTSGTVAEQADATFTVGSYNILHSENHTATSKAVGGCDTSPVAGDPTCAKTRTERQVKLISGQTGGPAFDILGTQENSPEQYALLKSMLPGYSAFPDSAARMNNSADGATAIYWNTSKFTKFESGKAPGLSNVSTPITVPWVGLQATSGQKVYVMSVHYATAGSGGSPDSIRRSSELTMNWVKSKVSDDTNVIVVGDLNDRLDQKLSYCVYTKASLMQHAIDMVAGAAPGAGCDANRYGGIDHIYATPTNEITASAWKHFAKEGTAAQASDHTPVYATYTVPGDAAAAGTLRVASFNIFHSADQPREVYEARLRRSMEVLSSNSVDIAGLQEVRPNQITSFLKPEFGGLVYEMYPKALKGADYSPNPIIWNKSKYRLVKTYGIPFLYFGGSHDKAPMVKLEDVQTKKQFYVANTHDPADARGEADIYRWQNAKSYAEYFSKLEAEGLPIIFTGDFNSGYRLKDGNNNTYLNDRDNLTYCILTKGTVFWDSYDASKKKTGTCPSKGVDFNDSYHDPNNANPVDHIYLSKNIPVSKYFRSPCCQQNNGSDAHDTIIAEISIGGEVGSGSAAPGKDYVGADGLVRGNCVDYAKYIMARHFPGYSGQSMGDGFEWAGRFGRQFGLTVNNTPAVHAVVSFPKGVAGANPRYGHVALVAEVRKDGSIVVEEFNWTNPYHYGTHVVSAGDVSKLTYAHSETKWQP